GATLRQLTKTSPAPDAERTADGNFQPSISDDGNLIAFSSDRDLTGANADANLEIFVYDSTTRAFTQITDSRGTVGATDAKISGDGSRVAFVRDNRTPTEGESTPRDLLLYERASNSTRLVASNVNGLALTYGRAASDDGSRVVYAARTATNTTQVFLFDGRNDIVRQITSLGSCASDVPLHPTISGDGSRIAFATRRSVAGLGTDGGVELYLYDLPTDTFSRITNASASATAEVISSLNDDGSRVAFNFPRVLSETVSDTDFANNSEIYLATLAARPAFSTNLRVLHGATFGKEPSSLKALAPNQIAIATGTNLALAARQAKPLAGGSFPQTLGGATLSVNARPAELLYVSPTQINFVVPAGTETGAAQVVFKNHDGYESRASVTVLPAAPGVFTERGDGSGAAIALDAQTLLRSPFDPVDAANNPRRITVFATGVRHAEDVVVTINGRALTVEAILPSPSLPGLDEIHVVLGRSLAGAGVVPLVVRADGRASNATTISIVGTRRAASISLAPATALVGVGRTQHLTATVLDADGVEITSAPVTFSSSDDGIATIDATGNAHAIKPGTAAITATSGDVSTTAQIVVYPLTLVLNEVLADPPDGAAGDANHDGVRSASQDEFIEIVNASATDLDIGGYQLTTRGTSGADAVRHTFAARTIVAPGNAVVVFGGVQASSFDPGHPAFAGALALTASTGTLSLTNTGGLVKLLDASGATVEQLAYGGESELDGDRNQSLTRSPDVSGDFALHQTASGSNGRTLSPGTRIDGSPFEMTAPVARIEVAPAAASVVAGAQQQFTARAFDADGTELQGVIFRWESSDTGVTTISGDGLAKSVAPGDTEIRADARGVRSAPAALRVTRPAPTVARVEVAPAEASLNRGGALRFNAQAFDANGRAVEAATFNWTSSDTSIASVDGQGFARGVGVGTATIVAMTSDGAGGTVSGQASLEVRVPLVINELLADVPPDSAATLAVEGDANRDGVRSADDDEFVELFNYSAEPVELSGVQVSDATTVRFTFPEHTTLGAGRPLVIFGGGAPPADAFGGALVFRTGSLSLNDTGDTLTVKLPLAARTV
ncbi:MAG TPA: Ig-like domain-containing protein, partial [Pyrinomonadaceae bacterium]|nr:Ig-like domain-containing protein [Pyrinomonadaceae bacterium]